MKESYGEGLATHADPESCGAVCKGRVEALTGARAGRVFSRERDILWDADAVGDLHGRALGCRWTAHHHTDECRQEERERAEDDASGHDIHSWNTSRRERRLEVHAEGYATKQARLRRRVQLCRHYYIRE
jgi:hypothetical protein